MTPYYSDDWLTLYGGDCLDVMREMPSDSVDCVITSPPYWGLRDYGTEGQLGLERTPEEYVANMVNVFREVRRVLKPSGTCWLNLGDSYSTHAAGKVDDPMKTSGLAGVRTQEVARKLKAERTEYRNSPLPEKNLVGVPWRVAFALQADGWYLRSDIIWSKPNPMPESVTDRPTKAHEYLFLLTKQPRYYFDADAVRETFADERMGNPGIYRSKHEGNKASTLRNDGDRIGKGWTKGAEQGGRNIRSVWNIATRPYPGAHFAVFPPELPERCIKAGSSEKGVCPECGAPWERVVSVVRGERDDSTRNPDKAAARKGMAAVPEKGWESERTTTGWQPTCDCPMTNRGTQPSVILDPFGGSGTVGMVANRLSRRAILIDLNPEYLEQQMKRNAQTPLGLDAA